MPFEGVDWREDALSCADHVPPRHPAQQRWWQVRGTGKHLPDLGAKISGHLAPRSASVIGWHHFSCGKTSDLGANFETEWRPQTFGAQVNVFGAQVNVFGAQVKVLWRSVWCAPCAADTIRSPIRQAWHRHRLFPGAKTLDAMNRLSLYPAAPFLL